MHDAAPVGWFPNFHLEDGQISFKIEKCTKTCIKFVTTEKLKYPKTSKIQIVLQIGRKVVLG